MSQNRRDESLPTLVSELWDMVVAYAKQETVQPIKGLGKFVAFGTGGALILAVGVTVLLVSVLRLLQTQTGGLFRGSWTWLPYFIAATVGLVIVAAAGAAVVSGRGRRASRGAA